MEAEEAFDRICQGAGEEVIVDLVRDPHSFPRVFRGQGSRSMSEWPTIDRELWPKPADWKDALANLRPRRAVRALKLARGFNWPMEPECGWVRRQWQPSSRAAFARGSASFATRPPTFPIWVGVQSA